MRSPSQISADIRTISADLRTVDEVPDLDTEGHTVDSEVSSRWSLSTIDEAELAHGMPSKHRRNITWPISFHSPRPGSALSMEYPVSPMLPERPVSPLRFTFGSLRRSNECSTAATPPIPKRRSDHVIHPSLRSSAHTNTTSSSSYSGSTANEQDASPQKYQSSSAQSSTSGLSNLQDQKTLASKPSLATTVGQRYSHMPLSIPPFTSKDFEDSERESGSDKRSCSRRCLVLIACLAGIIFAAIAIGIVVVVLWRTHSTASLIPSARADTLASSSSSSSSSTPKSPSPSQHSSVNPTSDTSEYTAQPTTKVQLQVVTQEPETTALISTKVLAYIDFVTLTVTPTPSTVTTSSSTGGATSA